VQEETGHKEGKGSTDAQYIAAAVLEKGQSGQSLDGIT